jgi:hypothetical protein
VSNGSGGGRGSSGDIRIETRCGGEYKVIKCWSGGFGGGVASTTTWNTDAEPYPVVLTVVSGMEMEYAWWIPDTA